MGMKTGSIANHKKNSKETSLISGFWRTKLQPKIKDTKLADIQLSKINWLFGTFAITLR